MRTRVRKAFTLVEILIVVVILGILAAIVIPQFTNATQDAQGGNIQSQLDTLNNQLELYKARHNGSLPADFMAGGATAWDTLKAEGYIKAAPRNPACPNAAGAIEVVYGAGQPGTADKGWNYDTGTNTLYACYFDEDLTNNGANPHVTPNTP